MIKAVFLDFDATLYSHFTNCIPSSAVKALKELNDKDIKVFICTGRSLYEMNYFDISMIHYDAFIANNGQLAYDDKNKIIYNHPINGELKKLIIDKFNNKKVPIFLNCEKEVFVNFVNDAVLRTQSDINSPIPNIKPYNNEDFYMCSAFYTKCEDWDDLLCLEKYANITYWHDGAVDIVPNTASKADGIKEILDIYNIKQEETIAFGDSDNDINMLEYCHIGVAMGNSTPEAIKVADYVTDHIEKDGIYNALKHFQII